MLIVNFNKGLFLLSIECFKENGDILNYKDFASCTRLQVSSEKQSRFNALSPFSFSCVTETCFFVFSHSCIVVLLCYRTASMPGTGPALAWSWIFCVSGNLQVPNFCKKNVKTRVQMKVRINLLKRGTVRQRKGSWSQDQGVSPGQAATSHCSPGYKSHLGA